MTTNVKTEVKGDELIITVNLRERHGLSKSGNTVTIAGTQGNQKLPGKFEHVSFGLNVYTKEGLDKARADSGWKSAEK